jgi:hypothetical protein
MLGARGPNWKLNEETQPHDKLQVLCGHKERRVPGRGPAPHAKLFKARVLKAFLFSQPREGEELILNGNFPQSQLSKNSQ